ncbi:50S ribosomal protein L9 [Chlamydiifrater phoenicopteri]|uniref:50S ribosomal protein L9 n=1 Tax=Chlamydiifrater phoenicopteri TaxID=2681469 RepID=UPI001BD17656|nr:50S ribosomal protein L9 [Chlamydiifrater phoenicopteri]
MKQQLLLLEDVDGLGRSGDIVTAKPGHVRNYLLPKRKAVIAGANTLKLQEKLREERKIKAQQDRVLSEALAKELQGIVLEFPVKVDPEQNMYGSVTVTDLIAGAAEKNITLTKKNFPSAHYAIKTLGMKKVALKLNEDVDAILVVEVFPEGQELKVSTPSSSQVEETAE